MTTKTAGPVDNCGTESACGYSQSPGQDTTLTLANSRRRRVDTLGIVPNSRAGMARVGYNARMSSDTRELVEICEQLPQEKRAEVADFARFLLAREGDAQWKRIINDPKPRPKLEEFLKQSKAEGSEPLDSDRL